MFGPRFVAQYSVSFIVSAIVWCVIVSFPDNLKTAHFRLNTIWRLFVR